MQERAGSLVLSGNLFDFAIIKTSVISDEFRARYLSEPGNENVFEGRAVVFDGSEDYHHRINDPDLDIDERSILVIRGAGPLGWPGSAEVVNMQPPDALLKRGITTLPTIGDGRQSGTSDSPSILHAAPESAAGGGLSWLRTGRWDPHRPQHRTLRRAGVRRGDRTPQVRRKTSLPVPENHTPWQEIYRASVRPTRRRRGNGSKLSSTGTSLPRRRVTTTDG